MHKGAFNQWKWNFLQNWSLITLQKLCAFREIKWVRHTWTPKLDNHIELKTKWCRSVNLVGKMNYFEVTMTILEKIQKLLSCTSFNLVEKWYFDNNGNTQNIFQTLLGSNSFNLVGKLNQPHIYSFAGREIAPEI